MAANAVHVECRDAETVTVSGALTFATAAAAWRAGVPVLAANAARRLDLSGVEEADSAGLAWVLATLASGRNKCPDMCVAHAPQAMRALARVCDAEQWLQP